MEHNTNDPVCGGCGEVRLGLAGGSILTSARGGTLGGTEHTHTHSPRNQEKKNNSEKEKKRFLMTRWDC